MQTDGQEKTNVSPIEESGGFEFDPYKSESGQLNKTKLGRIELTYIAV